jgi:eukaryotic-like serine/threonine-protein kinase
VAVKLLHPRYAERGEALARFRAEARLAGGLSQENIAQVFDYGEEAGGQPPPYLVMELVDGPSLEAVLAGGPRPSLVSHRLGGIRALGVALPPGSRLSGAARCGALLT